MDYSLIRPILNGRRLNPIEILGLNEISLAFPIKGELVLQVFDERMGTPKKPFNSKLEFDSYHWQLLKYLVTTHGNDLHNFNYFGNGFKETFPRIINQLIKPITSFLEGKLNNENSVSYVLNRYKRRVEWFFSKELSLRYHNATKNYEEILDQDLLLYLFDQGLEHPISKAKTASGSSDISGNLDKIDSFIIEIKIFDKRKSYGKERIVSGITQAYKYASDTGKPYSHLVIFNFDELEIKFNSTIEPISEIPVFQINGKTIFCLSINMNSEKTASKLGKLKTVTIEEKDIMDKLS
jgi:hypothetical protein